MNIFGRIFPKRPKPGMDDLSNLLRLARMVQAIERCMALAHIHDEQSVSEICRIYCCEDVQQLVRLTQKLADRILKEHGAA